MSKRRETPDVLGAALAGAGTPEAQNTSTPVHQHTSKPARRETPPVPGPPGGKDKKEERPPAAGELEKVKATFYISQEAADLLEDAWIQLRRAAPKEERAGISKSGIVEEALRAALEELGRKGEKSRLGRLGKG